MHNIFSLQNFFLPGFHLIICIYKKNFKEFGDMFQQYYHLHNSSYFPINPTNKVTYLTVGCGLMAPDLNLLYIRLLCCEME